MRDKNLIWVLKVGYGLKNILLIDDVDLIDRFYLYEYLS